MAPRVIEIAITRPPPGARRLKVRTGVRFLLAGEQAARKDISPVGSRAPSLWPHANGRRSSGGVRDMGRALGTL